MCMLILQVNYTRVLTFYGAVPSHALTIHGDINPMYFHTTGDTYMWIWFYIRYECHTDLVTDSRRETNVTIGNNFLWDLTGTPGLWAPPTYSYGEAVGYLIIAIVNSAYDLERVMVPPVCTHVFVLETLWSWLHLNMYFHHLYSQLGSLSVPIWTP